MRGQGNRGRRHTNTFMKIATWNVNSIRVRTPHLIRWLESASPDVVCLQETKVTDEQFPEKVLSECGYHSVYTGQKTYNGVAILAKEKAKVEEVKLPGGDGDAEARYLQVKINNVRIGSIYLPNGNPTAGPKFPYKLSWMRRLVDHAQELLRFEEPLVLCGDYNICPTNEDTYDPEGFADDAVCHPLSRQLYRELTNSGFVDALRVFNSAPDLYTYWDYQAGRWNKDQGLRIDHFLVSPEAADLLAAASVDKQPRGWTKPSDHTPVVCEFDLDGF